ncbi:hypothetical protein E4U41_007209 [Claviceps citrina]|nr:hypothetical protein E4U41_007209 [Claviceps citrina]
MLPHLSPLSGQGRMSSHKPPPPAAPSAMQIQTSQSRQQQGQSSLLNGCDDHNDDSSFDETTLWEIASLLRSDKMPGPMSPDLSSPASSAVKRQYPDGEDDSPSASSVAEDLGEEAITLDSSSNEDSSSSATGSITMVSAQPSARNRPMTGSNVAGQETG